LNQVGGLLTPVQASWARHVYHVYAIRVSNRDEVIKCLADRGIGTGIHYPVPVHLQEAYRSLGYKRGDFPVAERCAAQFVSLPMYPELTEAHLETVIDGVRDAVARGVEI